MSRENFPKVNQFLDNILEHYHLKNDFALCELLDIYPPVLSKTRHGKLKVGPCLILSLHEKLGLPVAGIRAATTE